MNPSLPAVLRLGTRASELATTQSGHVAQALREALGIPVELVHVTTEGDVNRAPLASLGGTGVFVSALRDALLRGECDLAVHSLKDIPTYPAQGITLAAVPEREDPRDVLVARDGLRLADLPDGARVGTGSPRRAAQVAAFAQDTGRTIELVAIRGNVGTRIGRVAPGDLDAVVLAGAGINRLGRAGEVTDIIDPDTMLPAPGQGALAVECRSEDTALVAALAGALDHAPTRAAVVAERAVLSTLEAGCSAPLGALAQVHGDTLHLRAVAVSIDGRTRVRHATSGEVARAHDVGSVLAQQMLADGAADLMTAAHLALHGLAPHDLASTSTVANNPVSNDPEKHPAKDPGERA